MGGLGARQQAAAPSHDEPRHDPRPLIILYWIKYKSAGLFSPVCYIVSLILFLKSCDTLVRRYTAAEPGYTFVLN